MSRLVAAQTGDVALQDYVERVAKYVPVEVVLAYLTIQSIFAATSSSPAPVAVEFVIYALLVVATTPYLIRFGGNVPNKKLQTVIGTVSFVVWTYGIGGQFFWVGLGHVLHTQLIYPSVAGSLVVVWSLATGLINLTPTINVQPRRAL